MTPVTLTKSLIAASANCIAQAQSVAAGASAVLNGSSVVSGAFTLDTQRRIAIVSGSNDSSNTARIYGNRGTGQPINEILALTNAGTAVSALDYLTGGSVVFPTGTAGTITIGTTGTGSTDWIVPNYNIGAFHLGVVTQTTGTVTYNVETTNALKYFDPPTGKGATTPQPVALAIVNAGTIGQTATLSTPVTGYRYTITSGTGTLSAQSQQSGIAEF